MVVVWLKKAVVGCGGGVGVVVVVVVWAGVAGGWLQHGWWRRLCCAGSDAVIVTGTSGICLGLGFVLVLDLHRPGHGLLGFYFLGLAL